MEDGSLGEHKGILIKLNDKNSYYLLWTDEEYSYSLGGSSDVVSREMLIEVAESIR